MLRMAKYYAVKRGKAIGIFNNWPECSKLVQGFAGAIFKSFKTKQEAEAYLGTPSEKEIDIVLSTKKRKFDAEPFETKLNKKGKEDKCNKILEKKWVPAFFPSKDGKLQEVLVTSPLPKSGTVEMKYKGSEKIYTPAVHKISLLEGAKDQDSKHFEKDLTLTDLDTLQHGIFGKAGTRTESQTIAAKRHNNELLQSFPSNCVICYTDGCCQGNPGPAGSGAYIELPGGKSVEAYSSLGTKGTNNIAELTAIQLALNIIEKLKSESPKEVKWNDIGEIKILTDSEYVIGVLTCGWKAKKKHRINK